MVQDALEGLLRLEFYRRALWLHEHPLGLVRLWLDVDIECLLLDDLIRLTEPPDLALLILPAEPGP